MSRNSKLLADRKLKEASLRVIQKKETSECTPCTTVNVSPRATFQSQPWQSEGSNALWIHVTLVCAELKCSLSCPVSQWRGWAPEKSPEKPSWFWTTGQFSGIEVPLTFLYALTRLPGRHWTNANISVVRRGSVYPSAPNTLEKQKTPGSVNYKGIKSCCIFHLTQTPERLKNRVCTRFGVEVL